MCLKKWLPWWPRGSLPLSEGSGAHQNVLPQASIVSPVWCWWGGAHHWCPLVFTVLLGVCASRDMCRHSITATYTWSPTDLTPPCLSSLLSVPFPSPPVSPLGQAPLCAVPLLSPLSPWFTSPFHCGLPCTSPSYHPRSSRVPSSLRAPLHFVTVGVLPTSLRLHQRLLYSRRLLLPVHGAT